MPAAKRLAALDREPSARRATMADIARLANVSKPTVSRVLSGGAAVTAEISERVRAVAAAQGYTVNRQARKLRQTRVNTIAVVLDFSSHRAGRIADPFIFELLAGVSEALSVRDQDLMLSPSGLNDARAHAELIQAQGADGFIFLGQGDREALFIELARTSVPFVVWGAADPAARYCTVGSDNRAGGRMAGEHFLSRGAKRWLFVGDTRHVEIRMRFEGLSEAASSDAGITIDRLAVEHMGYSSTHTAAAAWLASHTPPDAVFAFSDTSAMAVLAAFREGGHVSPRDFALVGYNDIPPAAHFTPAITTIEQPTHLAGAILVEKLMQRIEGARASIAVLPTRLVVRET